MIIKLLYDIPIVALPISYVIYGTFLGSMAGCDLDTCVFQDAISSVTYTQGYFETQYGAPGFSLFGVITLLSLACGAFGSQCFLNCLNRTPHE